MRIYLKKLVSCHPFDKLRMTLSLSKGQLSVVNCSSGQSLVEILIAIGLTGILLPALLTGLVSSREGKAQEGQRLQATALLRESEEAIRSVREKAGQISQQTALTTRKSPEIP